MDGIHPDLREIDDLVQEQFARVLRAERAAAAVARRRASTLRDRLIELEDLGARATIATGTDQVTGSVASVGADHVEIETPLGLIHVALSAIATVRPS